MMTNELMNIRSFPQINMRTILRTDGMKRLCASLLNNRHAFNYINRDYINALPKMTIPSLSSAGERVVSDLKNFGVAFADWTEFFDMSLYKILRQEFDLHLEKFNTSPPAAKGKAIFIDTIYKSHTFDIGDALSSYLGTPEFAAIAARYMGMVPRFIGNSFWHTRPTPDGERVYSQLWHRDYNDRRLLKVYVYLSDVGEKQGFFEYATDSHWSGSLGHVCDHIGKDGYREYPSHSSLEPVIDKLPIISLSTVDKSARSGSQAPWYKGPTRIQCTSPKTTLIFADTFGLHRGGHVIEGHRDMVMTTYSTNFNVHKPHFSVTKRYSEQLDPFMKMVFGLR